MTSETQSSPSLEPINDIPELHKLDVLYDAVIIAEPPPTWNLQFVYPPRRYSKDEMKIMLKRLLR